MYGKLNKNIGFSLIVSAFFFLFEPLYSLLDTLPDFIGYSILCFALINLADINDRISDAFRGFRKVAVLNLFRFICLFLLTELFGEDERSVGQLIFVFVFAFFELFAALPSYKALFEGLLSLATFHDGHAVFEKKNENGKNRTEKLYSLTFIFLVVKNVICALPEFTTLQTNSSYEFIAVLRIIAIIIVIPFSVVWLIRIVSYFNAIKNDSQFIESISEKYLAQANADPGFYISRVLCVGMTSVLISCILTFDIYSENVNYLPDLFCFALLMLSAIFLKNYSRKWIPITIATVIGCLASVYLFSVESSFFERHVIGAIKRDLEAYEQYYHMLAMYIICALISCAVLILLVLFIKDVLHNSVISEIMGTERAREITKGINLRLAIFLSLGILSFIAEVWHIFALPYFRNGWLYEYSGIISAVLSLAFISASIAVTSFSIGEIKTHYNTK